MATQKQQIKTLSPQLLVGGVPVRLSAVDLYVRSVLVESASGNAGEVYLADSEIKATSSNRHVLYNEGDAISFSGSMYADLNGELNLKDIWYHGSIPGDKLVVTYVQITGALNG